MISKSIVDILKSCCPPSKVSLHLHSCRVLGAGGEGLYWVVKGAGISICCPRSSPAEEMYQCSCTYRGEMFLLFLRSTMFSGSLFFVLHSRFINFKSVSIARSKGLSMKLYTLGKQPAWTALLPPQQHQVVLLGVWNFPPTP